MSLTSVHSKGTTIKLGDGASPEVFTAIGGINDVPGIDRAKSVLEDTSIDDSNRHYDYGIGEPPQITISMFWNPDDAQQAALVTAYDNETEKNFQAVMPDSPETTYTFVGIVTRCSTPYGGINELLMWDVDIQLNEYSSSYIVNEA